MRPEIVVRPYEAHDAVGAVGFPVADCVGFTGLINGRVAGFGGIHVGGGALWAVLVIHDERGRRPFLLHRLGLKLFSEFSGPRWRPVLAACDGANARAQAWLQRLGFIATEDTFGQWTGSRALVPRGNVDTGMQIWSKD